MTNAIARRVDNGEIERADANGQMTAIEVRSQVNLVQQVMRDVMQDGQHYGTIPGCGNKPTLLKPGAEKLGMTFRLAPSFDIAIDHMDGGHREYRITCTLTHIDSGKVIGQGVGSGSTLESKYRYRGGERKCPACGKATIIVGKKEYGGGYVCFAKKGGCGAKFLDDDPKITSQQIGKVENPDIADVYNTVLKMAKKRAQVDAILTATAASDIFTQDIEDLPQSETPMPRNDAPQRTFHAALTEAFDAAGVDEANQRKAVAMARQKYKVKSLDELDQTQWRNFLKAIADGKFSSNGESAPASSDAIDTSEAHDPAPSDDVPGSVIPPAANLTRWPHFEKAMAAIAAKDNVSKEHYDLTMGVVKMLPTSKWPGIVDAAKNGALDWKTGQVA